MNRIPSIGGARGIFEIFLPGIFLLLNLTAAAYLTPPIVEFALTVKMDGTFAWFVSVVMLISFGYLLGVMLRILRTERADLWSAGFLRIPFRITSLFYKILKWLINSRVISWILKTTWWGTKFINKMNRWIQKRKTTPPLHLVEKFPYTGSIGRKCRTGFPEGALEFYEDIWSATGKKEGKVLFNFCKVMLVTEDETITHEIYAAESLSRYISGMLYALGISFLTLFSVGIYRYFLNEKIDYFLIPFMVGYLLGVLVILLNFRFLRLKEADTMFAATFKNRDILFRSRGSNR